MPNQQTPAQARVIDPILSTAVRGYKSPQNILSEAIFPFVDVPKQGGTRIEFGKEDFMTVNTARAPGSKVAEVQFGHDGVAYACVSHALASKVPQEHVRETAGTPASDQVARANERVMRIMLLELEREQATLATTAASYAGSNKVTLSGGDQWSDPTSDILEQVNDAKAAVRTGIGVEPNTLVLPYGAKAAISKHNQVTEAIKYTQFGVGRIELLASFFEIERVFVCQAIQATQAGVMSNVWGDFGWLGYVAEASTVEEPSFGYTYRLDGHPIASEVWWDQYTKSWRSDVEFTRSGEIVGADAGYLFTDLVG